MTVSSFGVESAEREEAYLAGAEVVREAPWGIPGLVRAVRLRQPDAVACESERRVITYAELDALSDAFADDVLAATGGVRGVVAMVLPRGIDMMVAMLGVLKAGCWYLPVALDEPDERLRAMLETARPLAVLGGPAQVGDAFAGIPRLSVRRHLPPSPSERPLPSTGPDQPMYLMFTSGSSGKPKGVLQGSAGVVNRILWQNRTFGLTPEDRIVQKTPYTFDVSGWEFYCPLTVGARLVFLPEGWHREPVRLARFVREHRITACHFVPSMLTEFLRTVTPADVASVRLVFTTGEALPAPLCVAFHQVFSAGLTNLYGPTEAAIEVSYWPVPKSVAATDRVLIGRPVDNTTLHVMDDAGRPLPAGRVGELWIGGVQVALGYVGRPDLTARAFPEVGGSRFYRTGDLVRISGGELEFLGRADDQVKIRGVRIEAAEVERALTRHPAVEEAVVVAVDDGQGSTELLAALTPAASAEPPGDGELRAHLRRLLPPAYAPGGYHWLSVLPTLTSGKADRNAVRATTAAWWARRTRPVEADDGTDPLSRIWWETLPAPAGGRTEELGFLSAGGHSLLAVRVLGRVHAELGAELPLSLLLKEDASLAGVRAALRDSTPSAGPGALPAVPAAPGDPVPLPPEPRAVWLLSRLYDPAAAAYNVVAALILRGRVEPALLAAALDDVVERHQALRLRITEREDDRPCFEEVPGARVVLELPVTDRALFEDAVGEFVQEFARRPHPMSEAPLAGAALLRGPAAGEACLVLSLHHVIADQHTMDVVLSDLAAAYSARAAGRDPGLAPAPDFLTHARETDASAGSPRRSRDLRYWTGLLADAPTETALPFRYAAQGPPGFEGRSVLARYGAEETRRIEDVCRALAVTPFTLFLTGLSLVLRGWLGRDTLVLGVPVSRRRNAGHEDMAGFMLGTLPLRVDVDPAADAAAVLRHVRDRCAEAVVHGEPDFESIVRALELPTRPNGNPLFGIWVNDVSHAARAPEFRGLDSAFHTPGHAALFDVNLYVRREEHYTLQLTVAKDRVPFEAAGHLLDQVRDVIRRVLDDPARPVSEIVPGAEEAAPPAPPGPPVAPPAGVLDRIRAVAARTPSAVAVREAGRSLTYAELLARSDGVAARLAGAGVTAGAPVQVHGRRRAGWAEAVLGTWAAGAVPALVDAGLPRELLAHHRELVRPVADVTLTASGEVEVSGTAGAGGALPVRGHILFTSGTGGVPAAVLAPHTALDHAMDWYHARFRPTSRDRTALLGGLGHDPVLRDLLAPLGAGGTLVVPQDDVLRTPGALFDFLYDEGITLLHATPALLEMAAAGHDDAPERRLTRLRLVMSGGAPLTAGLARRVRAFTDAVLVNAYGTTETPQIASCQVIAEEGEPVDAALPEDAALPFGRGVAGAELLVVDGQGRPCAVGQRGEIVVRGHHLATGYLGTDRVDGAFSGPGTPGGARTFRTGDLGRPDPCGGILLDGRRDRQVLVNGFRVSLENVEAAALRHRRVRQARAEMTMTGLGDRLTLRVVPEAAGRPPGVPELRTHLSALLPGYAVPPRIDVVGRLGTDHNHKAAGGTYAPAPRSPAPVTTSPLLNRMGAVAEEVLGRAVGVDGNFFDEGLDSIGLLRFHRMLVRRLEREIAVSALFAHPTLRALARFLDEDGGAADEGRRNLRPRSRPAVRRGDAADRRRTLRSRLTPPDRDPGGQ
ncbi:amino acid adenylation domain-containing protein [Streptomyces sp. NPDC048436]|uniref:amino acid adenylation domain-containing protein n=1 Tax=Streptomyces sp. NPDC048436 TaxID=3365550 RepID=UPI0037112B6B